MNILHISSTDLMGGRFTGYYMQQALGQVHTVEIAVWNRTTDNPGVHCMRPGGLFRLLSSVTRRCDDKLGLEGLIGLGGWALRFQDYFKRADVVHLHLIHDHAYFSILSLPMLSRMKLLVRLPPFGGHPSRSDNAPGVTDGKSSIEEKAIIHEGI